MKAIAQILLTLVFYFNILYADPACELYVINMMTSNNSDIYAVFYPVSGLFNGEGVYISNPPSKYSLLSTEVDPSDPNSGILRREYFENSPRMKYIIGLDHFALTNLNHYTSTGYFIPGYFLLEHSTGTGEFSKWLLLGHCTQFNSGVDGMFGYGEYNLELLRTTDYGTTFEQIVQIPIDWVDFNYPYPGSSTNGSKDLKLRIYSISPLSITFQWLNYGDDDSNGDELPLFGEGSPPYNGQIEVYKQYYRYENNQWQGYNLNNECPPSKGNSISDDYFLIYPPNGRNLPSQYVVARHDNAGLLKGNLSINSNVSTPNASQIIDFPTRVTITSGAALTLNSNRVMDFTEIDTTAANSFFETIVENNGRLILNSGSKIEIRNKNKLSLRWGSRVYIGQNAYINVYPGGSFCNDGNDIRGNKGNIKFKTGNHYFSCTSDFAINDSVKFTLDSNATLEIPDSITLKFTGKETKLIMTPTSKLKMGVASKIILDSGARIIARNSTITSTDTTKLWDGIYSSELSLDTISNCKIINARNGINLTDKSDESGDYNVLITDCDFINKSDLFINSSVFAYNSDKILVSGNDFYGESTGGFYCGIYFLYCPSNEIVITDNNIEDSYVGIADFSSSAYIARNILNGNSAYGYGIQLDNS